MARAGRYRHRVEITDLSSEVSGSGAVTNHAKVIARKWASIWPAKASETVVESRMEGRTMHEIRWRFDPALKLTTKCEIQHEQRVFRIESFFHDKEARRETILTAIEVTG